ncbi:hypothetical protein ACIOBL_09895 [Paenibacillus taichungensis]
MHFYNQKRPQRKLKKLASFEYRRRLSAWGLFQCL